MGGHFLQRTGRTGLGGTGSPPQGVFGASCQANGGPSSSENRARRPGGDGESCPGGVRSLLPGLRGAIFFREPGAPARGGRGVQPRGCSEPPARPTGGHLLQRTGRTGLGGTGCPAQGVFGASCQANGGPISSENRAHRPGGDGESCPGGVRSLLPGQWGAIFFREPGAPARGGRGVLPRGCSEPPARPRGGHLLQRTGRTGPGGTGSPAQGVFGVSCQAKGGPSSSENRAHRPGGDGESCPGGVRSLLPDQWGAIFFREPGAPARGGRGVLPRGCSEPPARPRGGHLLRRTGRTGPGGTGSPAQRVFGVSCKAKGGPSSSENRAHRPGGDGESCPGGVRSLLPGQWGAIFFREPGAPARGGRGVLPRGCSESPARPMGGHLLQRTGRTGPGGTGSPAQGVFGVSCQANGGPSSSENRAHRPGGDGESSPGGVRSLLPGQGGAIFFREPGAPDRGGRGVLPRGCSEPPARPVGGQYLRRTGRTGLGGTGSPAQGVFGASGRTRGYSLLPLSSSRQVSLLWCVVVCCVVLCCVVLCCVVLCCVVLCCVVLCCVVLCCVVLCRVVSCCVVLCCVVLCCAVLCCVVLCCVVLCCVVLCCVVLCCVVLCWNRGMPHPPLRIAEGTSSSTHTPPLSLRFADVHSTASGGSTLWWRQMGKWVSVPSPPPPRKAIFFPPERPLKRGGGCDFSVCSSPQIDTHAHRPSSIASPPSSGLGRVGVPHLPADVAMT